MKKSETLNTELVAARKELEAFKALSPEEQAVKRKEMEAIELKELLQDPITRSYVVATQVMQTLNNPENFRSHPQSRFISDPQVREALYFTAAEAIQRASRIEEAIALPDGEWLEDGNAWQNEKISVHSLRIAAQDNGNGEKF